MNERRGPAERSGGTRGLEVFLGRGADAFRRRLGIGVFVAVLILVGVGVLVAWRQYDDGRRRALNEMRTRVVLAATVFDTYFAGQVATLTSIAKSPSVRSGSTTEMAAYFESLQGAEPKLFTGGLGWIDLSGVSRVSATSPTGSGLSLADRSYFKAVISSRQPYISEGLTTRSGRGRVVVMAVPTVNARGRISGVLAGALELRVSRSNPRTTDLGYEGLTVIDRAGQQLTQTSFAKPANTGLLGRLRSGEGILPETHGLSGEGDRAVAYANSRSPHWISVIDRPRGDVFASARRGLMVELASIAAAALVVLGIVGWAISRSRRDSHAEREQVRNWDELAQSLGEASAATEVAQALGAALISSFSDARAIVAVDLEDGDAMHVRTFWAEGQAPLDRRDRRVLALAREGFDTDGLSQRVGGDDRPSDTDSTPDLVGDGTLVLAVPLLNARRDPIGSITLLLPPGSSVSDADLALINAHADHAARALARARRSERDHDVALALQRGLLPTRLPAVDGLEFAGRYSAGGAGLEVGGDWYDAVLRPDGILHLTVGDVAGRGIPAAVLMGQLRSAYRALVFEHDSPAAIARQLARQVPDGSMATAVFLTLDPYTGELRYASAGHPPSLLLDVVTGETTMLDKAAAPPLGWGASESITEARQVLPSQMTLLAYTDGLVERRDASIDDGIARLAAVLKERSELGADESADILLRQMVDPLSATDDIALLLVRISEVPAVMHIEIPADPALLRGLRARLSGWLGRRGLGGAQRTDTILAVSEACNNAIEHAYRDHQGSIRLTLEHAAAELRITVEDSGTWRRPRADPTRGRGTTIMEGTMDTVAVTSGATGTRIDFELRLGERTP